MDSNLGNDSPTDSEGGGPEDVAGAELTARQLQWLRVVTAGVILVLGVVASLVELQIPRAQRNILFLLVSCLPAILFATEASARFKMRLGPFMATAGGAMAGVLMTLVLLDHLSTPELRIAVYNIQHSDGTPVLGLEHEDRLDISAGALPIDWWVGGRGKLAVIFYEVTTRARIIVQPDGQTRCEGYISYLRTQEYDLRLGEHLTCTSI